MGAKTGRGAGVYAVAALSFLSAIGLIGSAFIPWLHQNFTVTGLANFAVEISLTSVAYTSPQCSSVPAAAPLCQMMLGKRSITEERDMACSFAAQLATAGVNAAAAAASQPKTPSDPAVSRSQKAKNLLGGLAAAAGQAATQQPSEKCKAMRALWYGSWALMIGVVVSVVFALLGAVMALMGKKTVAIILLSIAPLAVAGGVGFIGFFSGSMGQLVQGYQIPGVSAAIAPVGNALYFGWGIALVCVIMQFVAPCAACALVNSTAPAGGKGEEEEEDETAPLNPAAFWHPNMMGMQQPGAFIPPAFPYGVPPVNMVGR